jgi:hypothetical protein
MRSCLLSSFESRSPQHGRSARSDLLVCAFLFASVGVGGCSSSTTAGDANPAPAPAAGPPTCIVLEVENTSLTGVSVWIEWENTSPQRMGRLSINARRSYRLPFRNTPITVRLQEDGGSGFVISNSMLPVPGDRLDIRYGTQGASPLRRTGVARC